MTLLSILIIIVSIAMGFFVLIQESKGGGLASNFASSNQIMGVHRTTACIFYHPKANMSRIIFPGLPEKQTGEDIILHYSAHPGFPGWQHGGDDGDV